MFMSVTECVDVCLYMCWGFFLCEGEVQLTCRQARVSPRGMSRHSGNTAGDTLQITQKKQTITAAL